jgi:hypothetical protein
LRTTAQPLGHALSVGAVNLRQAVALNEKVAEASEALGSFAHNPIVLSGLEDLTQTLGLGNPAIAGLASAQRNCNYVTLSFRNAANLLSESVGVGTLARATLVLSPKGPNNEGQPASAPANGPSVDTDTQKQPLDDNHVHVNPYPNVGPGVCEAGNEPYVPGKAVIGHVPLKVSSSHETTKREQDLFGERYPASTLADLGITSHKTAKKKVKKKGKRK